MSVQFTSELTGRKVAAIFIAFFGVVMAVNFTMARFATSTFGGVVVDNSYVASQHFNTWLVAAREQKALGWNAALARLPDDRVVMRMTGAPVSGLAVTAVARHPLGRAPDQPLKLVRALDGAFVSAAALPPGRWLVRIEARVGGTTWRDERELR